MIAAQNFRSKPFLVISFHSDRSDGRRLGDGRPRHARKDHRTDHHDMAKASFEMSDQIMGKLKQPLRDAAGIHQVARQDEKRRWQGG